MWLTALQISVAGCPSDFAAINMKTFDHWSNPVGEWILRNISPVSVDVKIITLLELNCFLAKLSKHAPCEH